MWPLLMLKPLNHLHTSFFHRGTRQNVIPLITVVHPFLNKRVGYAITNKLINAPYLSKITFKCPSIWSTQGSYITVLLISTMLLRHN